MMRSRSELAVPPFVSRGRPVTKYTSPNEFAETVRTAWKNVGHTVRVWVEQQSMPAGSKHPCGCIRSDLIAGLPRHVWLKRYIAYLAAGGKPVAVKVEAQPDVVV